MPAPDAAPPPPDDTDGDGVRAGLDCDDADPAILGPTDWEALLPGLSAYAPLLPAVPETPLPANFPAPVPDLRADRLAPAPWAAAAADPSSCANVGGWPADRVSMGPLAPLGGADRCRVVASPAVGRGDGDLVFQTRWPWNNIHVPANDVPGWVVARFPMPPGHRAEQLFYTVRWARLFGYPMADCAAADRDASGACAPQIEGPWEPGAVPGLFLLWSRPGGCGWRITGPHAPAGTALWSGATQYAVSVPEALRDAPELDVALLVYHQYPGGCDATGCTSGIGQSGTLNLRALSLDTRAAFAPPRVPAAAHPRLYGDAETFDAQVRLHDALPCAPRFHAADWGGAPTLRDLWDAAAYGLERCRYGAPVDTANNRLLNQYLVPGATWNVDKAYQALYLLRLAEACLVQGGADCPLTPDRLATFRDAYIATELARFGSWNWGSALGFDLDTAATIRFWSLFADVLWDHLTPEQHALIRAAARPRVDAFLHSVRTHFWPTHNGNNWTPVLGAGALHWAIAYWHEEPDAPEVAREALEIQWLHRGVYQADGVYGEGLLQYTAVSFGAWMQMERLSETSLGMPLAAPDRSTWTDTARWMLDFMASDGRTIDFGDSWATRGWGTPLPLYLGMGEAGDALTPCDARTYFSNKWFDHGFRDPWMYVPRLAVDYEALVARCQDAVPDGWRASLYPVGGWGGLRHHRAGATAAGRDGGPATRFSQADETFVALSAIRNAQPHTELDFAALIWTAYGNRLLADFGYGDLGSNRYDAAAAPDQNPVGHNTLVVEEALQNGAANTNTSQISGAAGTVEALDVGGAVALHADGAAVYGRDDAALGWLERFDRWVAPLPGGHLLVVDDFAVRADRAPATVAEYWHTEAQEPLAAACDYYQQHVAADVLGPERLALTPRCHGLRRNAPAEARGLIAAASLLPGHFVSEGLVSYPQRIGGSGLRTRTRYIPDVPVRADVRAFVLAAGVGATPVAEVVAVPCAERACFDIVTPDGASTASIGLDGALRLANR